jgi:hypothetical protein
MSISERKPDGHVSDLSVAGRKSRESGNIFWGAFVM